MIKKTSPIGKRIALVLDPAVDPFVLEDLNVHAIERESLEGLMISVEKHQEVAAFVDTEFEGLYDKDSVSGFCQLFVKGYGVGSGFLCVSHLLAINPDMSFVWINNFVSDPSELSTRSGRKAVLLGYLKYNPTASIEQIDQSLHENWRSTSEILISEELAKRAAVHFSALFDSLVNKGKTDRMASSYIFDRLSDAMSLSEINRSNTFTYYREKLLPWTKERAQTCLHSISESISWERKTFLDRYVRTLSVFHTALANAGDRATIDHPLSAFL